MNYISIQGVKTHNLKNFDLKLPRNKLIVITGLSGSGKSSLAFDTLYAEGQRRYVESLSAYARQFLSMMEKPDVDHIEGLSPAISIEQKSTSHNPRSTVGTITEIYDYLRLLFARVGTPFCPQHNLALEAQTIDQMVEQVLSLEPGLSLMLIAPIIKGRKGQHSQLLNALKGQGFVRIRINGALYEIDELPTLDKNKKHTIEVVVDRFRVRPDIKLRLTESFETAIKLAGGLAIIIPMDEMNKQEWIFSALFACPKCGYSLSELEPQLFSFNNPKGACKECDGLGVKTAFDAQSVVTHPELSLADGAIKGWDKKSPYYHALLQGLADHYGFSLEIPYKSLGAKHKKVILQGAGDELIQFTYHGYKDRSTFKKKHRFPGILPNMARRYQETDSQSTRDELAKFLSSQVCPSCLGTRLREEACQVFIATKNISAITRYPITQTLTFLKTLNLSGRKEKIASKILREIILRLQFLVDVGLEYLSLDRNAETLSGGETQRIRLASQIGAGLVGVLYILDEPSIGLHQRDNARLLETLFHLRDLENTVIVVEHDRDTILHADYVIDIGPGAGIHGGEIVAKGTPKQIMHNPKSITGRYLSGKEKIELPKKRTPPNAQQYLEITGCRGHNLKNIDLKIFLGLFTVITGVSGSGKSTLINHTLYPILAKELNKASSTQPHTYKTISGLPLLDKCIEINQSPIGRTPRSNPATYTGIFGFIRELYAGTQEARSRGYKPGRFSFNVKGGRCEACQGDGLIKVEMHFLPDIYVTCDHCSGKRYNQETLAITFKGKNINDVLNMSVEHALDFFQAIPAIKRKLQTLMDVGLSYIRLGQNATTLSGGEAQRIKLAKELSKRSTGKTLYILDEPTTGLHFYDIKLLLSVLVKLKEQGNTILVIEHNLDVIKIADWIVDLGPEGGKGGGEIIACGTPEQITKIRRSYTGKFLKSYLK